MSLTVRTSRNRGCTYGRGMTLLASLIHTNTRQESVILLSTSASEADFKWKKASLKEAILMYGALYTKPSPTLGEWELYSSSRVTKMAKAMCDSLVITASTR